MLFEFLSLAKTHTYIHDSPLKIICLSSAFYPFQFFFIFMFVSAIIHYCMIIYLEFAARQYIYVLAFRITTKIFCEIARETIGVSI